MKTALNLRTQLLLLVGGPLLALLLVETIVSYRITMHTADLVFDRWLLDSAYSLAQELRYSDGHVRFVADSTALQGFEWDEFDRVYFSVVNADGGLIAGSALPQSKVSTSDVVGPMFTDTVIEGRRTRGVSVLALPGSGHEVIVTVAETLNKRHAMTSDLLFEVLLSKGLLFVAVLTIAGAAFVRGLRPLVLLSRALAQRSPHDLTPIEVGRIPSELRGVVESTNSLLSRIDAAISSREQFIGNIAHQIRTPLAGMKLQAQLAERVDDINEVRTALAKISLAADRLSHVNSQLMKLARAEAASGRGPRREQVDLTKIVHECCDSMNERAAERGIELEIKSPEEPVMIGGEVHLLAEMVGNLIHNAIVYGREGGHVRAVLSDTPNEATLIIDDDGPGIDREHWPRIFERFFRPMHSSGEGCGLGLSIVREIALAHDASVELEERPEGSGTRFVIRFER